MLKVSDIIKIKIDKIVFGGEGLGYYNSFAVFVPMSVPEDELEIEIISVKKTYVRGLIKNIIFLSNSFSSSSKFSLAIFNSFSRLVTSLRVFTLKSQMTTMPIAKTIVIYFISV